MTLLAALRRANVTIALDGPDLGVTGATKEQQEQIRAQKPQIVAALQAEAFAGQQLWENTALAAGIEITYGQAVAAHEFGCSPRFCLNLITVLDSILELPTAAERVQFYVAEKPMIERILAEINEERRLMLEGKHAFMAAVDTFRKPKEALNAAIFG